MLLNPAAARHAARVFEEAYLREREVHGTLQEGYLRDLCRSFAGQRLDGRRFGVPGKRLALPRVSSVQDIAAFDAEGEVFGKPTEVQLDLCFGEDTIWLAEVRRRTRQASVEDVVLAPAKATFLRRAHRLPDGPTWFISIGGFTDPARARARELGVFTSGLRNVEAIRAEIAPRRPPAPAP